MIGWLLFSCRMIWIYVISYRVMFNAKFSWHFFTKISFEPTKKLSLFKTHFAQTSLLTTLLTLITI